MRLSSWYASEPPVFEGPGYIDIASATRIEFTMFATPRDVRDAMQRLAALQSDSYDNTKHFRLEAVDYQGTEWNGGWTLPRLKGLPAIGCPLVGSIHSLMTGASGHGVASESSVELLFHPRLNVPMASSMRRTTVIDDDVVEQRLSAGRQTISVLGSEITFFHTPAETALWVKATTSTALAHPYLENWLSEPLNILLGQFCYPRLVARNFGNGTAFVSLRPSPRCESNFAGLLGDHPLSTGQRFWELYTALLTLIATSRDGSGHPNFESHALTRYYEEVIQAVQGSRWVLCMTLASSVEGLVRLLEARPTGSVRVENLLKALERKQVINADGRIAWRGVRHAVAHGQLVSPWSTRDEDKRILDLAGLLRQLTHELLRRVAPPSS